MSTRVYMCYSTHVEVRRQSIGASFLLPSCEFRGSNLGHQTLPSQASCQPKLNHFCFCFNREPHTVAQASLRFTI